MDAPYEKDSQAQDTSLTSRRALLQASMTVGFGLAGLSILTVATGLDPKVELTPDRQPAALNDVLVFAQGEKAGQAITPEDVPLETGSLLAFPMDASTKQIKSGEVKNTIVLARSTPEKLPVALRISAAGGVVAYSAVCTHLGCTVSLWQQNHLYCPCHNSQFDPFAAARVVGGPAPRALPVLPIKLEGAKLVIAGDFQGKVGV